MVDFHWFKSYSTGMEEYDDEYFLEVFYKGGGDTTHSNNTRHVVQDIFISETGGKIPEFNGFSISMGEEPLLVDPEEMARMCATILNGSKCDLYGFRSHIKWLLELSKQGYYISYDED